jgi:hypothetical protein
LKSLKNNFGFKFCQKFKIGLAVVLNSISGLYSCHIRQKAIVLEIEHQWFSLDEASIGEMPASIGWFF